MLRWVDISEHFMSNNFQVYEYFWFLLYFNISIVWDRKHCCLSRIHCWHKIARLHQRLCVGEKFSNINDTFKRVIGILVNWYVSTNILSRVLSYARQNTCWNVSFTRVPMTCLLNMSLMLLNFSQCFRITLCSEIFHFLSIFEMFMFIFACNFFIQKWNEMLSFFLFLHEICNKILIFLSTFALNEMFILRVSEKNGFSISLLEIVDVWSWLYIFYMQFRYVKYVLYTIIL